MSTPESFQNDTDYAQADAWRRLRDVVRRGVIESVQLDPPRCRVSFGGEHKSGLLQWYTLATSEQVNWSAPKPGDPVTVISEGGDLRNGVVLLGLLVDNRPPPSNSPTEHVTRYSDGAQLSYDTASHVWTWQGVDGGRVVIDAKNVVEITGIDSVTITSATVVNINGGETINLSAQKINAVAPGGILLDGPVHITKTLVTDQNATFKQNAGVQGDLSVTGESAGSSGNITTKGSVLADKDVRDARGTLQQIRVTYNGHTHGETGGTTHEPNQPMLTATRSRKK
ncbi:phage baseplate assembly protein V [Cronobacter muytjensii]|uniref:phage baseplate assembly protein V n=1 Tax=Cronobacter muytjensii TaxID=413501 RepID=UPI002DBEFA32|nr:phage baseplate assembly protein V [Cronobacter muytjensii]MEB8638656.1 phage baseplate assembly protein V [Cronobacter muytjensii]